MPRERVDGQVGEERLDAVVEEAEDKEGVDALGDDQQEGPDGRPRTAHIRQQERSRRKKGTWSSTTNKFSPQSGAA